MDLGAKWFVPASPEQTYEPAGSNEVRDRFEQLRR